MHYKNNQDDTKSDSSFESEYSIFSRPLKELPVLGTMNFVYDIQEPEIASSQNTDWQN